MIYLDSSALLKLLFEETESAALARWMTEQRGLTSVTSALARVEVVRACRRLDASTVPAARALLLQLDLVPLVQEVLDRAADVGGPLLRSLDALHLASALTLGEGLLAFVAYDVRLAAAAGEAGLPVVQPGT